MKHLIKRLEEGGMIRPQDHFKPGDKIKVTKSGLRGRFSLTKRIGKGTYLEVVDVNTGRNRNQMVVKSEKHGLFTIDEDWDLGKVKGT